MCNPFSRDFLKERKMRATYSPEDNKLRLYPSEWLDAEDYARFKNARFKWAPKQELFGCPDVDAAAL